MAAQSQQAAIESFIRDTADATVKSCLKCLWQLKLIEGELYDRSLNCLKLRWPVLDAAAAELQFATHCAKSSSVGLAAAKKHTVEIKFSGAGGGGAMTWIGDTPSTRGKFEGTDGLQTVAIDRANVT